MIFPTTPQLMSPGGSWHPPDATSHLTACRQPSELLVARIAALGASICRDLFVGSMKLSFKRALTDKSHASIGLGHVLNWLCYHS